MNADRFHALVGVCPAILRESPSSWLTRAALGQGTTVGMMAEYLGWLPWRDIDLTFATLYATGIPAGISEIVGLDAARRLMAGLHRSGLAASRMLLSSGGQGRYRFCPLCLRTDSTPHVRQHWRFSCCQYCPDHQCLLEGACPHCSAKIQLPVALLHAGPRGIGVADLSDCTHCGRPLAEATARTLSPVDVATSPKEMRDLRNGLAAIAAMYEGWFWAPGSTRKRPLEDLKAMDQYGLIPCRAVFTGMD